MATAARPFTVALCLSAGIFCGNASAQSLSTVPGADIPAGERLFDYRAGFSLPESGRSGRFGQRLHYQQSLSDSTRLRLIIVQGEGEDGVLRTQNVIGHIQYQFVESEGHGGWDSAVRFDGFVPIDDRPGRARIVILNTVDLNERWQVRGDVFVGREIGNKAIDGFLLESRAELSYSATRRTRIGAQLFDNWNSTARFGDFAEQRHQLGVFARSRITDNLSVEGGWLFGLSRAAPKADLRVMLTYSC
ncbi:MAG: hypothetical protein U5J99_01430 [Parvularculaceae bacterium]|nr:hypothetical protein [Parvularculaceae bacterium]